MVKELKMNLNELIEIQKAMTDFRDAVIHKCDNPFAVNAEMCELSRCLGILRYTTSKLAKEVEVEIDTL